jgi:hypothetical protein
MPRALSIEAFCVHIVMPGHSSLLCADCVNLPALPDIHVLSHPRHVVDGRVKPGHDDAEAVCHPSIPGSRLTSPPAVPDFAQ